MLTLAQKRFFFDQGYLQVAGVVPRVMVEAARQAINHSIGNVGLHAADLEQLKAASFCNELQNSPLLTDLFNQTPLLSLAESLMGEGNVLPVSGVQIALRFPSAPGTDPRPPGGHLDGLGTGTNGIPKGTYVRGFTSLAVVYLADVLAPYGGNFTVWPRSHLTFQDFFRREGHEVLAQGMPRIDLPEGPLQTTGRAGDVIFAHYLTVHSAAPNVSPNVRYAAISRLRHVDCEQNGKQGYTDLWREWPAVREAVETAVEEGR